MNRKEQHINQLLRRWLQGDVNRSEEAELEAAARDDEFLAGAMEGYRQQAADDHSARLTQLRRRFAEEPSRRSGVLLWRVAAAVAVLVVAVGVLWMVTDNSPLGDLAMENQAAPETEEAVRPNGETTNAETEGDFAAAEEVTPATSETSAPLPVTPSAAKRQTPPGAHATAGGAQPTDDALPEGDQQLAAKESLQLSDQDNKDTLLLDGVPVTTEAAEYAVEDQEPIVIEPAEPQVDLPVSSSPVAPPSPVQAPAAYRSRDRVAISNAGVPTAREGYRMVQGVVKDEEGYPLIGATILQPGSPIGTVTDIDGSFLLSVDETSQALQVSYTGYETTTIAVADELDITLEESQATLDEVVVTGYSRRETTDEEESSLRPFARPLMGLSAFKEYMDEQTALVTGRGKVRLEFNVYGDGSIREIEVIRSTNPGLNAKAIELLQDGPPWEIVTGEAPVETVYVIRFR